MVTLFAPVKEGRNCALARCASGQSLQRTVSLSPIASSDVPTPPSSYACGQRPGVSSLWTQPSFARRLIESIQSLQARVLSRHGDRSEWILRAAVPLQKTESRDEYCGGGGGSLGC